MSSATTSFALNAGWDEELLAEELKALAVDLDFDIGMTGFSIPEIDDLIDGLSPRSRASQRMTSCLTRSGALPTRRSVAARTASADLRQLARAGTVAALMDGARAQMVFTDPPYNVPIEGHVGGSGSIKHREFAMASGEMTSAEFTPSCGRLQEVWRK